MLLVSAACSSRLQHDDAPPPPAATGVEPNGYGSPDGGCEPGALPTAIGDAAAPDATIVLEDAALDGAPDVLDAGPGTWNPVPRVFAYGNSLTWGGGWTTHDSGVVLDPKTQSYPAILAGLLGPSWEASAWLGRSGYNEAQLYFMARRDLDSYDSENRARVLVLWEGTNDVAVNAGACEAMEGLARRGVAHGWKVLLMTMLPVQSFDASSFFWATEQNREAYNACLRAGWQSWGVTDLIDLANVPGLDSFDPTYYGQDNVHLTAAGYDLVAHEVYDRLVAMRDGGVL